MQYEDQESFHTPALTPCYQMTLSRMSQIRTEKVKENINFFFNFLKFSLLIFNKIPGPNYTTKILETNPGNCPFAIWLKYRRMWRKTATNKTKLCFSFVDISGYRLWAKHMYRGMFETQKSGNKTSSGEIGLNFRTIASPKVGQDQASRGVSILCWHAAPVANVLWKPRAIR